MKGSEFSVQSSGKKRSEVATDCDEVGRGFREEGKKRCSGFSVQGSGRRGKRIAGVAHAEKKK
jgi:hypothetical protein